MKNIFKLALLLIPIITITACSITVSNNNGGGGDQVSWKTLGPNTESDTAIFELNAITFDSNGVLYTAGGTVSFPAILGGGVWKYVNNSWLKVGRSLNFVVVSMVMDAADNIYVSGYNPISYNTYVYEYTNGAWTMLGNSSTPMAYINALAVDESGNVYAGGLKEALNPAGHGVVYTLNNESWVEMAHLPLTITSVTELAVGASGSLFIGVASNVVDAALWGCANGDCVELIEPVSNSSISAMSYIRSSYTLYYSIQDSSNTSMVCRYLDSACVQVGQNIPAAVTSISNSPSGSLYISAYSPPESANTGYAYYYENGVWNQIGGSIPTNVTGIAVNSSGVPYVSGTTVNGTGGGNVLVYQ